MCGSSFLYFWEVLSVISLNGFPLVSLQAPYTLWRLGFVFPRGHGCSQMHEPSLSSAVQHVLHRYSPVCLGSQCGLVPWGGCSLSQQKGEALCLGYVKVQGFSSLYLKSLTGRPLLRRFPPWLQLCEVCCGLPVRFCLKLR